MVLYSCKFSPGRTREEMVESAAYEPTDRAWSTGKGWKRVDVCNVVRIGTRGVLHRILAYRATVTIRSAN